MGLALCCYPFIASIQCSPLRRISGVLGRPGRVSTWFPRLEHYHLTVVVVLVLRSFAFPLAPEIVYVPT